MNHSNQGIGNVHYGDIITSDINKKFTLIQPIKYKFNHVVESQDKKWHRSEVQSETDPHPEGQKRSPFPFIMN